MNRIRKDWEVARTSRIAIANTEIVAKAILENPNLTQKQIAKKVWISVGNVNDKINRLESSWTIGKDPRIKSICDEDIKIVSKANKVRAGYVNQVLEKLLVKELLAKGDFDAIEQLWYKLDDLDFLVRSIRITKDEVNAIDKISDTSQKRYSIFMGSITDENWWFNKLSEASTDDLWKKFNDLLWREEDGSNWSGTDWEGVIE